jgi:hypothetical protein
MRAFLLGVTSLVGLSLASCSSQNIEYVKGCSSETWRAVGYEIIGYEGYQWGFWGWFGYGGAHVWHSLKRTPDNGIIYTGHIQRWGDECHVYGPRAIDAISPTRR